MSFFLHPLGLCESEQVGERTRIWAFAHVLPGARIGADCNICDHVFIENDVVLGNRVTVKCGVQLWDGMTIEDDVFIGPNATFTNDAFPRSKQYLAKFSRTRLCRSASVGANATILPGVTIGQNAMIGAACVVLHSVPANAIVVGNPARMVGYVGLEPKGPVPASEWTASGTRQTAVKGVTLHRLTLVEDMRGNLIAGEFMRDVPFPVKRYFMVFDVPSEEVRGEHAHQRCQQFMVCVKGGVSIVADDGYAREEYRLDDPTLGLYLPPMVWGLQYKYTADAMLLIFASDYYDSSDYIRSYDDFMAQVKENA